MRKKHTLLLILTGALNLASHLILGGAAVQQALRLILGGAAVYRCDHRIAFECGFSR
jgi:hypothetical protein